MEKRIKVLYIVTIIAILAFLGMQAYWLYGRYEFSLNEHEAAAYKTIVQAVADLNQKRQSNHEDRILTHQVSYNINYSSDSISGKSRITATHVSQSYHAHELLGIKEKRKLTDQEKKRAARMVLENEALAKTQRRTYDVSNAPSESVIWGAFKNADAEFMSPLTVGVMDSVLSTLDLSSDVRLIVTDSMLWEPSVMRHASVFDPTAIISVPYSELEKKSVVVTYHLPPAKIFNDMLVSLVIVALLSLFLIICLVFQFATILKLSRLDRMRNSFVTTMIHELKRPISTLKMCVSGIENDRMMAKKNVRAELMSETRSALDTLSAYFSRLRDITFNDVKQIPLNITSVNLHDIVDDVMRTVPAHGDKTVIFKNTIRPGVTVKADRTHLCNILGNLVENAIKYSGQQVTVSASASITDRHVTVSISDTGNGISPSDIRHVFRRFYRGTASDSDVPGIGLGLAYVRLLVAAHGGDVTVESTLGKGSCFTITFPLR